MEIIENSGQKILRQEMEIVNAHGKEMVERKIMDARDVNILMDALCMDEEICKRILGESVYLEVKDSLQISKENLDVNDDQTISSLPEFQDFLSKYILNKGKQQESSLIQEKLDKKKSLLKSLNLPESIQKEKDQLDLVKDTIRDILSEKDEKIIGFNKTFLDIAKKIIQDNHERDAKINIIYDFIFDNLESSSTKKKRKNNESSQDFYKRIGIDYMLSEVRKTIQEVEKKIQSKTKKRKEKKGEKIDITTKPEIKGINYTQEALKIFREGIDKDQYIKSRFYLPEDKKQIERVQIYFKKHLKESITSPDMEVLIKDSSIQKNVLERAGDKIKINNDDYSEMLGRKSRFEKKFLDNKRNPRDYFFDRLIEYVSKDILKYKIQETINNSKKHQGTTFDIYKTDCLDDSSAGADYAVLYNFKGESKKRIALIDLFVSDKELRVDIDNENEKIESGSDKKLGVDIDNENEKIETGSYEEKLKKAKEPKIPYSLYSRLFLERDQKTYKMKPISRYVEKQSPEKVYKLLKEIVKNGNIDLGKMLIEQNIKESLYSMMKNKGIKIDEDIIQAIDKIAA